MFKKIFIITSALFLFSISYALSSIPVLAQNPQGPIEYTVLAPLPGTTDSNGRTASLTSYVPGLFRLVIGLAAVIATAYIIWGGFLYITTDAIAGKSEGKEKIKNAIYGLIMICAAWLILYTINPRLLNFQLGIGAPSVPSRFGPAGTLTTGCTGCISIPRTITTSGSGAVLTSDTLSKVQALNTALGASSGFRITDATGMRGGLPVCSATITTLCHSDPCHGNGTCIDANISSRDPGDINSFIAASTQAGLTARYEVGTQAAKDALVAAGVSCANVVYVPPRSDGTPRITAPHFSVYNGQSNAGRCP